MFGAWGFRFKISLHDLDLKVLGFGMCSLSFRIYRLGCSVGIPALAPELEGCDSPNKAPCAFPL